MHASRVAAIAFCGALFLAGPQAWGRAGPPAAASQVAPASPTSAVLPPVPADVQSMDPAALGRYYGIVRDGDAAMDCPQLNAELQTLAVQIGKLPPQPDWAALSDDMRPSVNPNVIGAGHMAASAVLSRVPIVGGLLAAASERPPGTDARMAKKFARFQQAQQVSMSHAVLHARRARVTQLFQQRGCKVSDFDPPPVLEDAGSPADEGDAPTAPTKLANGKGSDPVEAASGH